MASKSYWSYGKVNHKDGAMIPEGRVLIDTAKSFVYNEGGLKGILMASYYQSLSKPDGQVHAWHAHLFL